MLKASANCFVKTHKVHRTRTKYDDSGMKPDFWTSPDAKSAVELKLSSGWPFPKLPLDRDLTKK
jgi:hypothetical protein